MRTIKFRAKAHRVNGDIWIYGDLRHHNGDVCIFKQEGNCGEQVNRDTIGQFTGLLDKNGIEYSVFTNGKFAYPSMAHARPTDWICKKEDGTWLVLHDDEYHKFNHNKIVGVKIEQQ